jgi:hypothetical protein
MLSDIVCVENQVMLPCMSFTQLFHVDFGPTAQHFYTINQWLGLFDLIDAITFPPPPNNPVYQKIIIYKKNSEFKFFKKFIYIYNIL